MEVNPKRVGTEGPREQVERPVRRTIVARFGWERKQKKLAGRESTGSLLN